jgi:calcineurin-like phosphoesterase family protein
MRRRTLIGLGLAGAIAAFGLSAPALPRVIAATPSCQIDRVERIVAIGDVHGAYDRFVEILRTSGIVDARLRWAGGRAHLVQMGDVVDRGPDSRKALDLLERLQGEARRAGGAVHPLLGNHEVMRMLGDLRYVVPAEYEAFVTSRSERARNDFVNEAKPALREQVLKDTPLGFAEMRAAFSRKGHYGDWLRKLDTVVQIDGVLFVHGGISPEIAVMSCDVLNEAVRRELSEELEHTRNAPLDSLSAKESGPLWYRGLAQESDAFASSLDEILAKQNARAIVIGHTVTADGRIRTRFGGKVIQLDTGMQSAYVQGGRASALEIRNGVVTAIYTDRRDVLFTLPTDR